MADEGFDRINAIVKHRYETGDYGNTHFEMPAALLAELRETAPAPAPRPLWMPNPLGELLAIPVVIDAGLPDGCWRLVDNTTEEILFEGLTDG